MLNREYIKTDYIPILWNSFMGFTLRYYIIWACLDLVNKYYFIYWRSEIRKYYTSFKCCTNILYNYNQKSMAQTNYYDEDFCLKRIKTQV